MKNKNPFLTETENLIGFTKADLEHSEISKKNKIIAISKLPETMLQEIFEASNLEDNIFEPDYESPKKELIIRKAILNADLLEEILFEVGCTIDHECDERKEWHLETEVRIATTLSDLIDAITSLASPKELTPIINHIASEISGKKDLSNAKNKEEAFRSLASRYEFKKLRKLVLKYPVGQ